MEISEVVKFHHSGVKFVTLQEIHGNGTAQFKLDSTCVQQGHDTTCFSFHTSASLRVHARLVTSNLRTMQSCHVCTRRVQDACVHVRNVHTKFGLRVHANCKPRTAE